MSESNMSLKPVHTQNPSRPLGDEQDRSFARPRSAVRQAKARTDLRGGQRRSGERRHFERRSDERRQDERRADERRLGLRLSGERRLDERRAGERRVVDRRALERRSVNGRLGRRGGKRDAGSPPLPARKRRGVIDDYA